MTPTRWFIVIFWIVVLGLGAKSFYDYNSNLTTVTPPEQHWFPPPMPGTVVVQPSENADVRMIRYSVNEVPQASSFTADVVVQNFGKKKATNIQVRVQPYHGLDQGTKQPGPDEIENPNAPDSMATTFQWVDFPDLGPGQTETKTLTLLERTDAEPQTSFKPEVTFDSAKDTP